MKKFLCCLLALFVGLVAGADIMAQDMSKSIKLGVVSGQAISLNMKASAPNTTVKIKSGTLDTNITVGNTWAGFSDYQAGADTMVVYGDLTGFSCESNNTNVTSLDVSKNSGLLELICNQNSIISLDLSQNTALVKLDCGENNLTSLDVTHNTALEELHCRKNHITTLNVSACTSLKMLVCNDTRIEGLDLSSHPLLMKLFCFNTKLKSLNIAGANSIKEIRMWNTNLTDCQLDTLFGTLPMRTSTDPDTIYLKNGGAPDFNADGCRDTIATNRNWKVLNMAGGGTTPIVNTIYTCGVDHNSIITIGAKRGKNIWFDLVATAPNTKIRVKSGMRDTIMTVGTAAMGRKEFFANAKLISIYGKVSKFDCHDNADNIYAISTIAHQNITEINCSGNSNLSIIRVEGNPQLVRLDAYGNALSACGLDSVFSALPTRLVSDDAKIFIKNDNATNPGVDGCRDTIATHKQWKVLDANGNTAIQNDQNAYSCPTSSGYGLNTDLYMKFTVAKGSTINLKVKGDTVPSLSKIVYGSKIPQYVIIDTVQKAISVQVPTDATEITMYGNITTLDCSGNGNNLTNVSISNNPGLLTLDCSANAIGNLYLEKNRDLVSLICGSTKIGYLDVSLNTKLFALSCDSTEISSLDLRYNNDIEMLNLSVNPKLTRLNIGDADFLRMISIDGCRFSDCGLDSIFKALPARTAMDMAMIFIKNSSASNNPGVDGCRDTIATNKHWIVFSKNGSRIHNTTYTCGTGTDIPTVFAEGFTISPNPSKDFVTIESPAANEEIAVTDLSGRKLLTARIADGKAVLDISSLADGMYLVRIGNRVERLIKE